MTHLSHIALVVRDYDEAIAYYTEVLGFELIDDIDQGHKRWVVVRPRGTIGNNNCSILLAQASDSEQYSRVGNQTGGRVFLFLSTDDFWRDYHTMKAAGAKFIEEPRDEVYGWVVVFEDLYGNRWDLLQRNAT